jgi:hypothetical protein
MPLRKRPRSSRATRAGADVYRRVFGSLPLGLKVWRLEDPDDPGSLRLMASNAAAAEATGVPVDQVMGKTMAEAFPQAVPLGIAAALAEVARTGKMRDMGELAYGDARVREGIFSVFAFPLPDRCVGVAFENITREKIAEAARLRRDALAGLALRILEAANESPSSTEAYRRCLSEVCAFTRWPVGHVFRRAPGDGTMRSAGLWCLSDEPRFAGFKHVTESLAFERGVGLPGRVWQNGKPAWIIDVTADANFPRGKLLPDIGLKGAFGFPVLVDGDVRAVLEFFTPEARVPDEELLEVMERVGTYLAAVERREGAST